MIRVYFMQARSDLQAYPKFSGHLGPSDKNTCLCCDFSSYCCRDSRIYYLPACIKQATSVTKRARTPLVQIYDADAPRIPSETRANLRKVDPYSGLSDTVKGNIRKEKDIREKPLFHPIPSTVPFDSSPIDTMHLGYNIAKNVLEILKGENRYLLRREGHHED